MKKKLIVLSLDALQSNDLDILKTLPNFSKFYSKASIIKNMREIYPTLTYPIHTTLITGVYPDVHGISHNQTQGITREIPDWSIMGSDWYWYKENIKVRTLVDEVHDNGGLVATVTWPVTAGDKRGFNIPEIWPIKLKNEDPRKIFEKASSPAAFKEYYDSYIGRYNWKDNTDLRVYSIDIAVDLIRNHKPDLLLHHIVHLDHARHIYGENGDEIENCLKELDIAVGRIIQATIDAGTFENTNFILLGDHGQINIENIFNINLLFVEDGFIELDELRNPINYDAYSFSAGFSSHIILKNPKCEDMKLKVYNFLLDLKKKYPQFIDRIYTAEEVHKEEGLLGNFSFVIEGTKGTMFYNSLTQSLIVPKGSSEDKFYKATHGHNPQKGKKPPFIAFGPDILEGVVIEHGSILASCPTLSKLLGLQMKGLVSEAFPILKI